jgi:hypothetical protein
MSYQCTSSKFKKAKKKKCIHLLHEVTYDLPSCSSLDYES